MGQSRTDGKVELVGYPSELDSWVCGQAAQGKEGAKECPYEKKLKAVHS